MLEIDLSKKQIFKYTKYVFTVILIILLSINSKTLEKWDKRPISSKNSIPVIGNLKLENECCLIC